MIDYLFTNIVSVKMNEDNLQYVIILPGISKDKVSITVSSNQLTVKTEEKTAFGKKFFYTDEYNYGKKYIVSKAKSTLLDGVLTITIPLKEPAQNKVHNIVIE